MPNVDDVRAGMEIIGADGVHIGTVAAVEGRRIKMKKADSGEGSHAGHDHYLAFGLVAAIGGNKIRLSANGDVANFSKEEEEG